MNKVKEIIKIIEKAKLSPHKCGKDCLGYYECSRLSFLEHVHNKALDLVIELILKKNRKPKKKNFTKQLRRN